MRHFSSVLGLFLHVAIGGNFNPLYILNDLGHISFQFKAFINFYKSNICRTSLICKLFAYTCNLKVATGVDTLVSPPVSPGNQSNNYLFPILA